jgi:hypothetical protein
MPYEITTTHDVRPYAKSFFAGRGSRVWLHVFKRWTRRKSIDSDAPKSAVYSRSVRELDIPGTVLFGMWNQVQLASMFCRHADGVSSHTSFARFTIRAFHSSVRA